MALEKRVSFILTVELAKSELLWLSNQAQRRTSGTNDLDTQEQKISKDQNLAVGFDYDPLRQLTFCEACPQGKQKRNKFTASNTRAEEALGLVHSDVCGKMNVKSEDGTEYLLSFIDDKTQYTWVYPLRIKDQFFQKFCEWKTMVEKSTGKKLKALHTGNGGEYTSKEFQAYLTDEGVCHELTIPKTPE